MTDRRMFRGLPFAAAVAAGVLLGHWLTYLLAIPEAHAREELLHETGHGYWMLAVKIAVALIVGGVGTIAIRRMASRSQSRSSTASPLVWLGLRLMAVQVLTFCALEVGERLVSSASVWEMLVDGVFGIGLIVQALTAWSLALVLIFLSRAAGRLEFAPGRSPRLRAISSIRPRALPPLSVDLAWGAWGVRGPPSR